MVQPDIQLRMSLADFIEEYHRQPFELVNGECLVLSPNVSGHQLVARTLFRLLDQFLQVNAVGEVIWETPFVLMDQQDWVTGSRTPDLVFYTARHWAVYSDATPDWREKPMMMVPDLAVEIISPNDRYTEINAKVDGYLADGAQIVWVIDPQRRRVVIHRANSDQQTTLRENGILTGDMLLPGLSIPVGTLFQ